jgi:AcrR family transcriptional regulator
MTMGHLRARQPQEKIGKREHLLEAATELWQEASFADFKMSALAERAGVAKGTLYLYFSTKEQLFLNLLEERLYNWMRRLAARLDDLEDASPRTVARVVREEFENDPSLDRLLPMLESVLEHGIGKSAALAFKRRLLVEVNHLAASLEAALPELQKGDGVEAAIMIRALHTGFRQMSDVSPVIREVLDSHRDLAALQVDFARDFENALAYALRGLLKKKGKKK